MALNLASPGVSIREIDQTVGRIDPGNSQIAGFAGPFQKGPVYTPTLITSEKELISIFGKPSESDNQNEYWMSASTYLSYGGVLSVVRAAGNNLKTANVGVAQSFVSLQIKNLEDYQNVYYGATSWSFAARSPGSWANDIKVCVIDNLADQIITGVGSTGQTKVTATEIATKTGNIGVSTNIITGINTGSLQTGYFVVNSNVPTDTTITNIGSGTITIDTNTTNGVSLTSESFTIEQRTSVFTSWDIEVGKIVSQRVTTPIPNGDGTTSIKTLDVRGIITKITNVNSGELHVKLIDRVDIETNEVTKISYKSVATIANANSFNNDGSNFKIINQDGTTEASDIEYILIKDWYNDQKLDLKNNPNVYWKSIAPKPGTSEYAEKRGAKNDEVHIVVIDDSGKITGTSGQILEKWTFLSKGVDTKGTLGTQVYYKKYLENSSIYLFAGASPSGLVESNYDGGIDEFSILSSPWCVDVAEKSFDCIGSVTFTLSGGNDYGTNTPSLYDSNTGYESDLAAIIAAYELFRSPLGYDLDFLISGPSASQGLFDSQYKANALISIAEERKDCIVTVSPHKGNILNVGDSNTQTNNIIEFFDSITSSSYAVFDSGYKYAYDRFNNKFVYIPCNADIAGLMAKTAINNYPWVSPAGSYRGAINNAVKLAYNPTQSQRDLLYSRRINPIISSPGQGVILFGDKTGLAVNSALDRINVRRLFLTLERTIARASRDLLFEFNDEITRNNFVNLVDPYLRDVKAKRGISDFVVVCDDSNNTPDVIDANEFVADIYIKPARSINFIGLTFVATRTGVSFSEIIGNV